MVSMLNKFRYKLLGNPIVGPPIRYLVHQLSLRQFTDSESYWTRRYAQGGNSGQGSYNELRAYKAEVINRFVAEHAIASVIELGCGDGSQLQLAKYPQYIGYDISPAALAQCRNLFKDDPNKSFHHMQEHTGETADLALSLDVIFHLIEDDVFDAYMRRLFSASCRYVLIYSSNQSDQRDVFVAHVKHRLFTAWIDANMPQWKLIQHIPNRYPYAGDPTTGTFADFFIYELMAEQEANKG